MSIPHHLLYYCCGHFLNQQQNKCPIPRFTFFQNISVTDKTYKHMSLDKINSLTVKKTPGLPELLACDSLFYFESLFHFNSLFHISLTARRDHLRWRLFPAVSLCRELHPVLRGQLLRPHRGVPRDQRCSWMLSKRLAWCLGPFKAHAGSCSHGIYCVCWM